MESMFSGITSFIATHKEKFASVIDKYLEKFLGFKIEDILNKDADKDKTDDTVAENEADAVTTETTANMPLAGDLSATDAAMLTRWGIDVSKSYGSVSTDKDASNDVDEPEST